jgi:hypothetical protein
VYEKNHSFGRLLDRLSATTLIIVRIIDMRAENWVVRRAPLPALCVPVTRDDIPQVVSSRGPVES